MPQFYRCQECGLTITRPNRLCEHSHRALRAFVQPVVTPETRHALDEIVDALVSRVEAVFGTQDYLTAVSHGASSSLFQNLMKPCLEESGFSSEVGCSVVDAAFKPDFTLMNSMFGVMVEVERGKTLDNNMDMLDMWKCHVHPSIRHLILMVPIWYEKTGVNPSVSASFARVCRRMAPFFEQANFTNVHSLHLVGY